MSQLLNAPQRLHKNSIVHSLRHHQQDTMSEMSSPRTGYDMDSNYVAADLDDEQGEDDDDLAEMFAKVQSIQEIEGRRPAAIPLASNLVDAVKRNNEKEDVNAEHPALTVQVNDRATGRSEAKPARSASSQSPSATSLASRLSKTYRADDGIKTITRHSSRGNILTKDALLGPRKPQIYNEHILQNVLSTNDSLERLKKLTVATPPG